MTEKLTEEQMRNTLIDMIGVERGARSRLADELGMDSSALIGSLCGFRAPPARLLAWAGYKRVQLDVYYEKCDDDQNN